MRIFLHVRCCAHIVNLILYEGLKDINDWADDWVPNVGVLRKHATISLSMTHLMEKVSNYLEDVDWNIQKLAYVNYLEDVDWNIHKLAYVHHWNVVHRVVHRVIWGLSKCGNVSVKFTDEAHNKCVLYLLGIGTLFEALNFPHKIQSFLKILLHRKVLTNM